MKPEHFKDLDARSCSACCHRMWVMDKESHICTKHAFTLPVPLHKYGCDDFCDQFTHKVRRPILYILGDNEYRGRSYTLIVKNVWVTDYINRETPPGSTPSLSGTIEGYADSAKYQFSFNATDVLVEET